MKYRRHFLRLIALLCALLSTTAVSAISDDDLMRLEADMLKYIGTNERDKFYQISNQLKEASNKAGNERLFYKSWSKQAVYEATHQNTTAALEINKELTKYAQEHDSHRGQYYALHTNGTILMQKDEYEKSEQAFLEAMKIRHQYFPNESAAEDLRELIKIAYLRNNHVQARQYAYQLLSEPNLAPHHKGRTLYRLSIMAFEDNDVEEFNRIYEEMKRLMQTDGIRSVNIYTEVNYHIINGDYKQALRLTDWLSPDTCAERKALIYHLMGDNEKAYEYMAQYKHIFDSLTRVTHANTIDDLYLRMNNDRLRLEREVLRHQNEKLNSQFYIAGGAFFIIILLFLIWKGRKAVKSLKYDNMMLNYGKKDAERALEDLNELSFYESKNDIPLIDTVKVNEMCNRLTGQVQQHCHKGVTTLFKTELPDELEIKTNEEALEKLISHLLNYSARFTHKGSISLSCALDENNLRFSVIDTSAGMGNKPKEHQIGMFAEQGNSIRYVGMNFNICQSITRLLHGRIWHDNTYLGGTCFHVEIPLNA